MHNDQVDIDLAVARSLIHDQFPALASLPVTACPSSGTVNTIVRIGDELAARFPLRLEDRDEVGQRLRVEASAAERMAAASPVPVPTVVGIGSPGAGFPMPWSVQTWLPGEVPTSTSLASSVDFASDVAGLITALREADVRGETFRGDGRGGELAAHDDWIAECLHESTGLLDIQLLDALWQRYRALPAGRPDLLNHSDLIPANLLTAGGRLVGVLDPGGFGPADPSLDLVAAWHLLDAGPRQVLRDLLGSDDLEWARGKAWAFQQALGALWYYLDTNRPMAELGAWTLRRIVEDETGDARSLAKPGSRVWAVLDVGGEGLG